MRHILIKTDGEITEISPKKGKRFELKELQELIKGPIEHVSLKHGNSLWLNEEGKLIPLPINTIATLIWEESYGKTDIIVGNVMFDEVKPIKNIKYRKYA